MNKGRMVQLKAVFLTLALAACSETVPLVVSPVQPPVVPPGIPPVVPPVQPPVVPPVQPPVVPPGGRVELPLNTYQSLQVITPGYTDRFLLHRDSLVNTDVVNAGSGELLKKDSSFRLVRGLADATCYSLESLNVPGAYLRHSSFRIRLDKDDAGAAYRPDATWCSRPGLSGQGVSFESKNVPGSYLRHANSEVWLSRKGGPLPSDGAGSFDQDASWTVASPWWKNGVELPREVRSFQVTTPGYTERFLLHRNSLSITDVVNAGSADTTKQDASFRLVPGLADPACSSLESVNYPGKYLRHSAFRLRLGAPGSNDPLFGSDATFCAQPGLSGTGVSLESLNMPGSFVRHVGGEVWMAAGTGLRPSDAAGSFAQDASWNISSAWSVGCSASAGSVTGGGPKQVNLKNVTDRSFLVAFFRNIGPGMDPNFGQPNAVFTVAPGCTQQVAMPRNWKGRAQKYSGTLNEPSNWAEINFETKEDPGVIPDGLDRIWFDESDIPGRNSSMLITAGDGVVGGLARSVLGEAPSDLLTTDSSGERVLKPAQSFNTPINYDVVNFLRAKIGATNAYALPDDNGAVRVSLSGTLTIEFGKP